MKAFLFISALHNTLPKTYANLESLDIARGIDPSVTFEQLKVNINCFENAINLLEEHARKLAPYFTRCKGDREEAKFSLVVRDQKGNLSPKYWDFTVEKEEWSETKYLGKSYKFSAIIERLAELGAPEYIAIDELGEIQEYTRKMWREEHQDLIDDLWGGTGKHQELDYQFEDFCEQLQGFPYEPKMK